MGDNGENHAVKHPPHGTVFNIFFGKGISNPAAAIGAQGAKDQGCNAKVDADGADVPVSGPLKQSGIP